MRNTWKLIMDWRYNPLSHIPDMNTRHMVMQVLAWMWCILFSMWVGSVVAFGISALAHALLIAGIFITAGVFETAKRRPQYFGGLGRAMEVSMNRYRIDLSGQTVGLDFDVELYVHADSIKDVDDIFREYDIVRLQVVSPDDGGEHE